MTAEHKLARDDHDNTEKARASILKEKDTITSEKEALSKQLEEKITLLVQLEEHKKTSMLSSNEAQAKLQESLEKL